MDWTHFWGLLSLAAALLGAGYACYLRSGAPGTVAWLLTWPGSLRTVGLLFFATGVLTVGLAQRFYDYSMPPKTLTGTVLSISCYRGCLLRAQDINGKVVDFPFSSAYAPYGLEHKAVRVHYTPSSHEAVSVDYTRPDGTPGTVAFGESYCNVWILAAGGVAVLSLPRKRVPSVSSSLLSIVREPGTAP